MLKFNMKDVNECKKYVISKYILLHFRSNILTPNETIGKL